jgi:hypothetical protein
MVIQYTGFMEAYEHKTHVLKTAPEYFQLIYENAKTAELRLDDGRNFNVGDLLLLKEWGGDYSGRELYVKITHVLNVSEFIGVKDPRGAWKMLSFLKP